MREIVFLVIPELAARLAALATGEVDIITEVAPDHFETIAAMPGREVVGGPILNMRVLVFDKTNPVLADPRVRRALGLAIDRKAIVDALYRGRTSERSAYMHPAFGALYDAARRGTPYDAGLAARLVRESGYAGQPIPYRLVPNYYTLQNATAQTLVEMWRAVGVNVELQFVENWTQVFAPGNRGIRDWSNSLLWQDPLGGIWRLYGPRGPVQASYREWSNEDYNRLGAILESSLDLAERRRAFAGMLDIYETTDPIGTPLHDLIMVYGKKSDVGWTPYPGRIHGLRAGQSALCLKGARARGRRAGLVLESPPRRDARVDPGDRRRDPPRTSASSTP